MAVVHRAHPESSGLCDVCAAIDFASFFKKEMHRRANEPFGLIHENENAIRLGTIVNIRKKAPHCPFCSLVDCSLEPLFSSPDEDANCTLMSYCCGYNSNEEQQAYRIRVHIENLERPYASRWGDIQLLGTDALKLGMSPQHHARHIPPDRFDVTVARKWLRICNEQHAELCKRPEEQLPSLQPRNMYAIDLDKMRVCNLPQGSEFATLSYCWPQKQYLTLTQKSKDDLFCNGSLDRCMDQLPGTVQDAILCAGDLGFRYLWIDALCIVQDDIQSKYYQLRQMDRVYSASLLTIVAASPVPPDVPDPCNGLPGYRKAPAYRERHIRIVQGLRMMPASQCLEEILTQTRWESRCWTFQEAHLSRRLLYFTHHQVYFQCFCNVFCEDTIGEDIKPSDFPSVGGSLWNPKNRYRDRKAGDFGDLILSRAPIEDMMDRIDVYHNCLRHYCSRQVSYPSDYLNAFEGVMAVLHESMRTAFWQGLPEVFFDHTLNWCLSSSFRRRRVPPKPGSNEPRPPLFPSWTWAGWDSSILADVYIRIAARITEVEWFIINQKKEATQLLIQNDTVIKYTADGNKNVAPPMCDMTYLLPNIVPRMHVNPLSDDWRNAREIATYTTVARFLVDGTLHTDPNRSRHYESIHDMTIKDSEGHIAGGIWMPTEFLEDSLTSPQIWDFMLVSRSLQANPGIASTRKSFFDERVYPYREWCTLHVLMVSWTVRGTAIRVGAGIIHEDAWIGAGCKDAFVVLE